VRALHGRIVLGRLALQYPVHLRARPEVSCGGTRPFEECLRELAPMLGLDYDAATPEIAAP
jgi:hypothetical protein